MHIERIHFDEVFDVQALRGDFSFRSRGPAWYGVNLQNRVIPRAGSRFAVAFEKPGDWTTVLGCRDLASTEVTLRQPTWTSVLLQGGDLLLVGPLLIGAGLMLGGAWPGLIVAALLLLAMVYVVIRAIRVNRAVTQALLCLGENNDPLDNSSALRADTGRKLTTVNNSRGARP